MSRYWATTTTAAGSTTLPPCALVGGTGSLLRIRQIEVYNTTTTACIWLLTRLSTAGTPGTAATTRLPNSADTTTSVGSLKGTYTSTAPTTTDLGRKFAIPAAIGGGIIMPFDDYELTIPATAAAGVGFVVSSGTGQACEVNFIWQE